jgi:putative oxidoreductase
MMISNRRSALPRFIHALLNSSPAAVDLGLLVIRLAFGLSLAIAHGKGKVPPSERFIEGAAKLGFPAPEFFAWAAALGEFGGGILIAVGLFTRPAAFLVLCTMATAFFLRHGADPYEDKEMAMLYGVFGLAMLIAGAGRYSLDAWLANRLAPKHRY